MSQEINSHSLVLTTFEGDDAHILAWLGRQGTAAQLQPYLSYHKRYFQKGFLYFCFYKCVDLPLKRRQTQLGGGGCQILLSNRLRNRDTGIIYVRQFG